MTYDANGGSGDVPVDPQMYAKDALADVKSDKGLTPPQGKIFLGWSTNPDATPAEVYPYGKLTIGTENVILYAIWGVRENTVAITYNGNGGALTDGKTEYTISSLPNNGKITVERNTFAKAGYNFVSWNTQADGQGTSFAPDDKARVNSEGENVLYAIWEACTDIKYTVEFYHQNTDGTYPTEANASVERRGTTDTEVEVESGDKKPRENNKYVWDETASNITSGTVSAVEPLVLKLYFKLKDPSRFMMISDCSGMAGAPVGQYKGWHPGMIISITPEGFCLSDTGRLCGSSKPVLYGIGNLVEKLGMPMSTVSRMASLNPAKKYGLADRKGSLEVGKDADCVVITDDYQAVATYVRGRKVYDCQTDTDLFNPEFYREMRIEENA